jgi:DNA mismatch repair protein MSH5
VQVNKGLFLDSTSLGAPSENYRNDGEGEDGGDDTLHEVSSVSETHVGCALTKEQVIMAVDLTLRGTVGCCYYVARDEKLYFMEDLQFGEVDVVDARKYFITTTR